MAQTANGRSAGFDALEKLAAKLAQSDVRRPGSFQFKLSGDEAEEFALDVDKDRRVAATPGAGRERPVNLVTGDGKQVRMILEGKRDAGIAFLAGAVQFRGDIRYLERVLHALKLAAPRGGRAEKE
jgi:hypothetical protein